MDWLDEDLASRSVDDRLARNENVILGTAFPSTPRKSERISLLTDTTGSGERPIGRLFFAGNFKHTCGWHCRRGAAAQGPGLVRETSQTCGCSGIPTPTAGRRFPGKSLHYGYGVRVGFSGARSARARVRARRENCISASGGSRRECETGRRHPGREHRERIRIPLQSGRALSLRCFSFGLRKPAGSCLRRAWEPVHGRQQFRQRRLKRAGVLRGGRRRQRLGEWAISFMETPYSRGPFNAEKLWHPHFKDQAAYIVPPITNIAKRAIGKSRTFPATGLPEGYKGHFFLVDFSRWPRQ